MYVYIFVFVLKLWSDLVCFVLVMYPAYAKWVQSHRDLPIKLNQWCNVVVSVLLKHTYTCQISYLNTLFHELVQKWLVHLETCLFPCHCLLILLEVGV